MDQELIAYLESNFAQISERFAKQDEKIESFREETTRRFGHLDEGVRHTQVLIEGLRGDLGVVAEGVIGLDERLMAFRKEVAQDIDEVRKLIRPIYSALDQRVRNLEVSKDIEGRDVIQMIRERFIKSSD